MLEHIVTADEAGKRVREVLRQVMGVSYTAMKSAKWDGRILVNDAPARADRFLACGDRVAMLPAEDAPVYQLKPYPLTLSIPYLDDDVMVIDKPAPLASQSSARYPDDSLENAVYAFLGCPSDFVYRPVNRLDKGTSGLMVVARSAHAQHRLQQQLHTPDFCRTYLAVTDGVPEPLSGIIDAPIAKIAEASVRRVISPDGKPSVTHYEVLESTGAHALVRLVLETGRTHQIRVHLSSIGCPVTGDFLYGTEIPELAGRFALHSAEVTFAHPLTGAVIHLESPLPASVRSLLDGSPR